MELAKLGAISTGIVVVLSIALIVPAFTQKQQHSLQKVMLSFSIISDRGNLEEWCNDLSAALGRSDAKAMVFVTGSVADTHPECITLFSDNTSIDIGSQTYSYADLAAIPAYEVALDEVIDGKLAVDKAGEINSKLFRAPYGSTNENIYSLLHRSGILVDFSYKEQYNLYNGEQFIKYDLASYNFSPQLASFLVDMPVTDVPIVVNFDNSVPAGEIDNFVEAMSDDSDIRLVNASDLVDADLTVRRWLN